MRHVWIVVCLVMIGIESEASACLPRCPSPEGPIASAEEERFYAETCEMLEEDLVRSVIRFRETDLVQVFKWYRLLRRNAAAYRARAEIASR